MTACTICGRPAFARLRVEIDNGNRAITYIVCPTQPCIVDAANRCAADLTRAVDNLPAATLHPDAIDTTTAEELP